ncbi:hypothetical protein MNB_SM-7-1425 [hydrothermal vent metagenome]|uniref:Uncharacterized protein n=1 Tax=hydrothermal vent metagenome TaxID=652676 RepID=A0A1W1BWN7_9ZZZZ
MFLPTVQRFIEFGYIKNDTLFVVLSHNAGKQELDNNIKMIKDLLKSIKIAECEGVRFSTIKAFVTNRPRRKREPKRVSVPFYKERSSGEFDIEVIKDEELRKIAKEIQEIIKHNEQRAT